MKKICFILLAALISTALFFGGCVIKFNNGESSVEIWDNSGSLDNIPSELRASTGSTFSINLEANATTGYSWNAAIDDETIVTLVSNEYTAEDTDKIGSGGVSTLTFSALKKGETEVTLTYAQDWEGGNVNKKKKITIIVE